MTEMQTKSAFLFVRSPAVTEKYTDAPDVAVGGGGETGLQKQRVQAQAAVVKQAEKITGIGQRCQDKPQDEGQMS